MIEEYEDILVVCESKEKDDEMKILHINSYYSNSRFYKNLYDNQISKGLDIDVFIPVPSTFNDKNFDYGSYSTISKSYGKYDRYIFHLKHHKIYKDIQEKLSIDDYSIIHTHSLFSNGYIAMKLKKQYGIPYIVAVRDTDINVFFRRMIHLRKLGVKIMEEASHVIFLSKTYRKHTITKYIPDYLQEKIYNKTSIIPNGIDEFWINNVLSTPKQTPENSNVNLLHVGEISKRKNITTTVKAIDILVKRGYNVKLDVVGKIKNQKTYDKIKDLNYINYLGYKSKKELIKIYRENDIFVLPSITETFGLVYPEAMSQGLPVIYTKNQGFDGQFEDGEVGFAVDCLDANAIAERVIDISNDYKNFSSRCLKLCTKFDWNYFTNQYYKIYSDAYISHKTPC